MTRGGAIEVAVRSDVADRRNPVHAGEHLRRCTVVERCSVLTRLDHIIELVGELDRAVTDAWPPHGASHPHPMRSATEASTSERIGQASVRVDTIEDDNAWPVLGDELLHSIFEQFVPLVGRHVEVAG